MVIVHLDRAVYSIALSAKVHSMWNFLKVVACCKNQRVCYMHNESPPHDTPLDSDGIDRGNVPLLAYRTWNSRDQAMDKIYR